jgi:hypothetical protein
MIGPGTDPSLPPPYWNQLSQEDKAEFIKLRAGFHHGQKISSRDRRVVTFRRELLAVLGFLERSPDNIETRAVLAGVCFAGPIVCVNTRQLKSFLARCKSSINGSFQQLCFVALRAKSKARDCVVAVLPSLANHQAILRQWTVRYTSSDAEFCFLSSMSHEHCPEILPEDLFEEKHGPPPQPPFSRATAPIAPPPFTQTIRLPPPPPHGSFAPRAAPELRPKFIDFDLPLVDGFSQASEEQVRDTPMKISFSMNDFGPLDEPGWAAAETIRHPNMKKSGSVQVQSFGRTWNLFEDDEEESLF